MRSKTILFIFICLSFLLYACGDDVHDVNVVTTVSNDEISSNSNIVFTEGWRPTLTPTSIPTPSVSSTVTSDSTDVTSSISTISPLPTPTPEPQIEFVPGFSYDESNVYVGNHIKIKLQNDGWDIFRPNKGVGDYRYGSSILIGNNGMDAYFAAPGDVSSELDCIVHKHSDDNGETWSSESVVLTPMPLSRDCLSVCDPDVFYYNGYYYLGYTGTMDASKGGVVNSAFVARSENLDGPFEKWNGSGWGGNPDPLIYYDGIWGCWGVGEPAFVVKGNIVYVYCTKTGSCKTGGPLCKTAVYTADITQDDWPAHLCFEGYTVDRTTGIFLSDNDGYVYQDSDSWDVAYDEAQDKFIAIASNRRFLSNSCLVYYESDNGIDFKRVSELNTNVYCGSHNAGIASDKYGHIRERDDSFLVYSYGGAGNRWGTWSTRLVPIDILGVDEIDNSEDNVGNVTANIVTGDNTGKMTLAASVRSDSLVKYGCVGSGNLSNSYSYRNGEGKTDKIDVNDAVSTDSEKSIGMTVSCDGANRQVKYCVLSPDVFNSKGVMHGGIKQFLPPVQVYNLSLSDPYTVTVRPLIEYNDYTLYELVLSDLMTYGVSYSISNSDICIVSSDGNLVPVSEGETSLTVSLNGGWSFTVNVHVYP